MARLGKYCKAYPVAALREFEEWDSSRELNDDHVLFVQEDFTVTDGVFLDENVVFDQITPEWKAFCTTKLGFEIPSHITNNIPGSV